MPAAAGPSSDSSPMPGGGYLGGLLRDTHFGAVFSRPAKAASRGYINFIYSSTLINTVFLYNN